jgi:hypothetical protein
MHLDVLHLLAKQRHAELLERQRFRHHEADHLTSPIRSATSTGRLRRSLGTALVATGTRLQRGTGSTVDLLDPRR